MNVSRKNKKAITVPNWDVPGFLVSQFFLNYPDAGGAISKRMGLFIFDNVVPRELQDTTMEKQIIQKELPSIIYQGLSVL